MSQQRHGFFLQLYMPWSNDCGTASSQTVELTKTAVLTRVPIKTAEQPQGVWLGVRAAIALFVLLSVCVCCSTTVVGADFAEASSLYRSGKYQECIELAASSLRFNQGINENVRILKMRSEMELGRYPDALRTYETAVNLFPASIQLRWWARDVFRMNNRPQQVRRLDLEIEMLLRRAPWHYSDTASRVVAGRYLLDQGLDPKQVLDGIFKEALNQSPDYLETRLAIGDLALSKYDYQLAGEHYQQAIKIDARSAEAQFGVARAFAASNPARAIQAIEAALQVNPQHTPSLLWLAESKIDAEEYDDAQTLLEQVLDINPSQPLALALQAVLAHLQNDLEQEQSLRQAALKHWQTNPAVDHLIGQKLSQKYRFREGAEYQRQALYFEGNYLPAKMQLAQDLLRLGDVVEGLNYAQEVYKADQYNVFAHNLVALEERLKQFQTLEAPGLLVRMDAREANIYGARVVDLLTRAKTELCLKYEVELSRPITVEIFPQQQDFAIRTFGLPGGAGFLGVCFGTVITANSPAAQGSEPANWEATLWHEFCHVVTLEKTNNKMPRWLSEGISVYEERQADRSWGQSLNPRYREFLLASDLTPVSELSGAFLAPESPLHLQFAYYQSSLVVEYLIEQHGLEALKRLLDDLGLGIPINQALARQTGSIEALDARFAEFARLHAESLAPNADWSPLKLPPQSTLEVLSAWVAEHPQHYAGLLKLAETQIAAAQTTAAQNLDAPTEAKAIGSSWVDAASTLQKMLAIYPEDVTPRRLLAAVYHKTGETELEQQMLTEIVERVADDQAALARLSTLAIEAEDWTKLQTLAEKQLAINPLVTPPHAHLALVATQQQDTALGISSNESLLALDPFDPVDLHLALAHWLRLSGQLPQAKRHVLLALEETPRYRQAQQQLLALVQQIEAAEADENHSPAETQEPDTPEPIPSGEPVLPADSESTTEPDVATTPESTPTGPPAESSTPPDIPAEAEPETESPPKLLSLKECCPCVIAPYLPPYVVTA